jgi:hypothetical protein
MPQACADIARLPIQPDAAAIGSVTALASRLGDEAKASQGTTSKAT